MSGHWRTDGAAHNKATRKFQILHQVSADCRDKGRLTRLDLHVALALTDWADDDLSAWRSQKLLAEDLGLTLNGVRGALDRLIRCGHLKVISGGLGRGHSTVYQFILKGPKRGNNDCTIEPDKEQQPLPVPDQKRATAIPGKGNGRSHKGATAIAPTPCNQPVEDPVEGITSLQAADQTMLQGEFQQLWKQYPRKAARAYAFKAFKKARMSVDLSTIIAGVMRYSAEREGQDPRYTKHLVAWLNGECWHDEPTAAPHQPSRCTDAKSRTGDKSRDLLRQADEAANPFMRTIEGSSR